MADFTFTELYKAMSTVDWVIVIIIGLSTLISLKRGFVKEALSLVTWIAAIIISRMFSGQLSYLLTDFISVAQIRTVVAYVLLFVVTLMVGALVNHLIGEVIKLTGLSGADRMFGTLFGLARGMLIVLVMVALLNITPMTADGWWRESFLIPHFLVVEEWSRELLLAHSPEVVGSAEDL